MKKESALKAVLGLVLEYIECYKNNITQIDIRNNPLMNSDYVDGDPEVEIIYG